MREKKNNKGLLFSQFHIVLTSVLYTFIFSLLLLLLLNEWEQAAAFQVSRTSLSDVKRTYKRRLYQVNWRRKADVEQGKWRWCHKKKCDDQQAQRFSLFTRGSTVSRLINLSLSLSLFILTYIYPHIHTQRLIKIDEKQKYLYEFFRLMKWDTIRKKTQMFARA